MANSVVSFFSEIKNIVKQFIVTEIKIVIEKKNNNQGLQKNVPFNLVISSIFWWFILFRIISRLFTIWCKNQLKENLYQVINLAHDQFRFVFLKLYCVSKKYLPILCCKLLYNMGHYFLDTQYVVWSVTRTNYQ